MVIIMFYYIRGPLVLLEQNSAAVDAAGVAYRMSISRTTYEALPKAAFRTEPPVVTLYTYLAVREDGMELYGFACEDELASFRMLISVSGVGPKVALSVLSQLTPEKFALAVCTEDKKSLSKANGVGPKTAARIILELKDKLANSVFSSGDGGSGASLQQTEAGAKSPSKAAEAADALMVLGYNRTEALAALRDIDIDALPLEDIIRTALKKLIRQ